MYRDSLDNTRYNAVDVVRTKTVFNLPLRIKEPSKIFTSSLTDFFHPDIDSYREEAWQIIRDCPQHTFQILTKRPERILENLPSDWRGGYKNVWLGTSIGSQASIERAWRLLDSPSKVYFLSIEPLHSPVDLDAAELLLSNWRRKYTMGRYIDWVIVGGESGNDNGKYKYRECRIEWIEKIVVQCQNNNVPVFVKQLGTHLSKQLKLKDRHGGSMEEWPEHLQVRTVPDY
jgi:protein gp37